MAETKKLIGAAALSLAIAGGGVVGAVLGAPVPSGAQETTTEVDRVHRVDRVERAHPHHRGPHLESAAEALGMTEDALEEALRGGSTIADIAAERGVDIETVVDAIVDDVTADVRAWVTDLVNGERPALRLRGELGARADAVAEALGMTGGELRAALVGGSTIAEVAEAEGVDVQVVIDALVAEGVDAGRAEALVNGELRRGHLPRHRRGFSSNR